MINELKGTTKDCPSNAHIFDWVNCNKCVLNEKCNHKENRDGCRCGVEGK